MSPPRKQAGEAQHTGGVALLLASRSPRRAALLAQLGVAFRAVDVEVDESPGSGETPAAYVTRLAVLKAGAGWHAGGRVIPSLGADTAVVVDGAILGKPAGDPEAGAMLARLGGRWHEVYTAVAVSAATTSEACVVSRVHFRALAHAEIAAYVATGEPRDKAGGYGVQGLAAAFIDRIEGSYSAIVGLPLCETATLLTTRGVPHALNRGAAAAVNKSS